MQKSNGATQAVQSSFDKLLSQEHRDVTYLKQEHISIVIARALEQTYSEQPIDPVSYFSKILLNHCNVESIATKVSFNRPAKFLDWPG